MNPRIPHHKVVMFHVPQWTQWEWTQWSINYGSLPAMFTLLDSSTNQELFEIYVCNQSSHYVVWCRVPQLSSETEVSIALLCELFFNSLHSSTNQELFEKYLYNQSSHYGRFLLRKGSGHVQPPN